MVETVQSCPWKQEYPDFRGDSRQLAPAGPLLPSGEIHNREQTNAVYVDLSKLARPREWCSRNEQLATFRRLHRTACVEVPSHSSWGSGAGLRRSSSVHGAKRSRVISSKSSKSTQSRSAGQSRGMRGTKT